MNTYRKTLAMIILPALMLSGCGGGLSGTYSEEGGVTINFKGSTVEAKRIGKDFVGSYEVKDGKVYITADDRTEAYEIDGNCILLGPPSSRACKK